MTVKDIMIILETMPQDAHVYYLDTWWESEGWYDESAWNEVDEISCNIEDNIIHLI